MEGVVAVVDGGDLEYPDRMNKQHIEDPNGETHHEAISESD
jgi:hypothetical protein